MQAPTSSAAFFAKLPKSPLRQDELRIVGLLDQLAVAVTALIPKGVSLNEWAQKRVPKDVLLRFGHAGFNMSYKKLEPGSSEIIGNTAARVAALATVKNAAGKGHPNQPLASPTAHSMVSTPKGKSSNVSAPESKGKAGSMPALASKGKASTVIASGIKGQDRDLRNSTTSGSGVGRGEEALRSTTLSFLQAWTGEARPTLAMAGSDASIKEAKKIGLAPGVSYKEFIEDHLGDIIKLTPELNGQFGMILQGGEKDGRDRFLASLPSDRFTPGEEALIDATTHFIQNWKGVGSPTLSHTGSDAGIQKAKRAFSQTSFLFKEWIEQRLGDIILLTPSPQGNFGMTLKTVANGLTSDEETLKTTLLNYMRAWKGGNTLPTLGLFGCAPVYRPLKHVLSSSGMTLKEFVEQRLSDCIRLTPGLNGQHGMSLVDGCGALAQAMDTTTVTTMAAAKQKKSVQDIRDEFYANLPVDSFPPAEEALLDATTNFIRLWTGSRPPTIGNAVNYTSIREAKSRFLPPQCSYQDWVTERLGAVVELTLNAQNQSEMALRESGENSEPLSEDEEALRRAIMKYLETWTGDTAPTLSMAAGLDPDIKSTKKVLTSLGCSFKEWIETNLCSDVQLIPDHNGQIGMTLVRKGDETQQKRQKGSGLKRTLQEAGAKGQGFGGGGPSKRPRW